MSYAAGETLILTRVRACTGFSSSNTAQANWKIIGSGRDDCYAIIRAAETEPVSWQASNRMVIHWKTAIEVWQRLKDDGTSATSLYNAVNNLLAIAAYPRLGDNTGTVQDADIETIGIAEEMSRGDKAEWLRQTVTIGWYEVVPVTFAE